MGQAVVEDGLHIAPELGAKHLQAGDGEKEHADGDELFALRDVALLAGVFQPLWGWRLSPFAGH
jgi:hypothetical protein